MSKLASEKSVWLKEYTARVSSRKESSNSKKIIMPIMLLIMAGGLEAFLIFGKDGLNDPQLQGPIKIVGIVAGVMLILTTFLIALGKKKNVTSCTSENLDELLTTEELVREFDAQMKEPPVFKVVNDANSYFFGTRTYLGQRFPALGNETYTFVRFSDIASLHYVTLKENGFVKDILVDIRDRNGKILMNGHVENKKDLDALISGLESMATGNFLAQEDSRL